MKAPLLDDEGHQYWLAAMSDGVNARFAPAYIGGGHRLHAVDVRAIADGHGRALCWLGGPLRLGVVLDDDAICASCKRILDGKP